MSGPLSAPSKKATNLKRVAILFAGGPAPAANAVISTAAAAFQRNDIEVVGIMHGYSHLASYSPEKPLEEGKHWVKLQSSLLKRSRSLVSSFSFSWTSAIRLSQKKRARCAHFAKPVKCGAKQNSKRHAQVGPAGEIGYAAWRTPPIAPRGYFFVPMIT